MIVIMKMKICCSAAGAAVIIILVVKNIEDTVMKILNNLAVTDRIEVARTQNWTDDYWPFVFPIKDMNKCKCRNREHLRQYLYVNDYIKLPRRVIIKDWYPHNLKKVCCALTGGLTRVLGLRPD